MGIPNVPSLYQKIRKGAEGGHEFARIMSLLLVADGKERHCQTHSFSDAAGDHKGVDFITKTPEDDVPHGLVGVQFKFYPSPLSSQHKRAIKLSLDQAIIQFPEMRGWILVTPDDFVKSDMEWFDSVKKAYDRFDYPFPGVEQFKRKVFDVRRMGHTEILHLMLYHPEIGRQYYEHELFPAQRNNLVLSKVMIDSTKINWRKGMDDFEIINFDREGNETSSELVFDFHFLNNSDATALLYTIDIVIEDTWTLTKGFLSNQVLKSIGTIEWKMNFKQKINAINLTEMEGGPIIFKYKEPQRFSLQLNQFAKKCPGNMASLHFVFHFDTVKIKSESYTLNF